MAEGEGEWANLLLYKGELKVEQKSIPSSNNVL